MPSSVIQWFPGHMAKTKRLITECLPLVDIVIEVLDARIPVSSKNPVLDSLLGQKPRLAVFSKSALADPEASRLWQAYYRGKGTETIFYDCRSGDNLNAIAPKVREILGEKLERYESKGMTGRKLACIHHLLHLIRKLKQTQGIGNRRARFRDALSKFLLRHGTAFDEVAIGARLFNDIEVSALNVLNKGKLKARDVIGIITHHNRHIFETGSTGRLIAPLTGNNLITLSVFAHHDRLNDANLFDRGTQLIEIFLIELGTRLIGVAMHFTNRNFLDRCILVSHLVKA